MFGAALRKHLHSIGKDARLQLSAGVLIRQSLITFCVFVEITPIGWSGGGG